MKTSTILKKALAKLNNGKNWCKGYYTNGRGHYCIYGAINLVEAGDAREDSAHSKAVNAMAISCNGIVSIFNDDPRTKFKDVKAAFKTAIKNCKAIGD